MNTCKRFGYICTNNDVIVKVKPITVEKYFENGFICCDFEIIEIYNFFTKEYVNEANLHRITLPLYTYFVYNEHDASIRSTEIR
jgi:hypothetical protein